MTGLADVLFRLVNRDSARTEADVQSDVRTFLLTAPFQLDEGDVENVLLESPLGDRRRIDVEVGSTVVEVKRDLRRGRVRKDAEEQLAGYVAARAAQTGRRYAGVLTDGAEWCCYSLKNGNLREVSSIVVSNARNNLERLTVWVEGVLATASGITPNAAEIQARVGAGSSAHALDRATLSSLYEENKDRPTVQMKRALWARLLTSALGTQFDDDDELFIEHTLLVNSAEIIAHAVLGFPLADLNPVSLLSGAKFDESGIHGVVEADFFDWVLEVEGGVSFVRTLARRLSRFDWDTVEQDVLKILYESVIVKEVRKRLGEYYTPDWLAERMVEEVVANPLDMRVLDPACGSGTFLFHAVRKYLESAEAAGIALPDMLDGVTKSVIGMDLHPVAVTLARVTYLLAIGRSRLMDPSRGLVQIPVYLGDSMQWQQQVDLWTAGNLVIRTEDSRELFASELRFPDVLLESAAGFDQLVTELADKASNRRKNGKTPSLSSTFARLGIAQSLQPIIEATFKTMCRLHDEGRDHIWAYYIRNLARPMWLARESNRVDVLIGNPPWLAYRHMTEEMQKTFREMSEIRGLWRGAEVATQQDLCGLFVARVIQLYLRDGGAYGLVMPIAAIDRLQYEGFRSGDIPDQVEPIQLEFRRSWDLRRLRPHFFPRAASVVFGKRSAEARPMTGDIMCWSGRLAKPNGTWEEVRDQIEIAPGTVKRSVTTEKSPYTERFYNGATIFPRVLFFVERLENNPLGTPAGRVRVRSTRSANEKVPWKEIDALEGVLESEFLRPVLLSGCLLPFKLRAPMEAVIPWVPSGLLEAGSEEIDLYPGLADWWRRASKCWVENRRNGNLSLTGQLDYMSKLSKQFPIPEIRVIYNKSGMHIAAAISKDRRSVVENGLYWTGVASQEEADYLIAILNCPVTTEVVRPFMSYGKDERDIAKQIWQLPILEFDNTNESHRLLARLGQEVRESVDALEMDESLYFTTARRRIRRWLEENNSMRQIGDIVFELLS